MDNFFKKIIGRSTYTLNNFNFDLRMLDFNRFVPQYTLYNKSSDELFLNFLNENFMHFSRLEIIYYTPTAKIDVSILREIKTLKSIFIPFKKIKSLDFILELPNLHNLNNGYFLDSRKALGISEIKQKVKYHKNIFIFV